MAFKQPKVPEYREDDGVSRYIKSLVIFLKDFSTDVWTANRQRAGEIKALRREVERLRPTQDSDGTEA